MSRVSLHIAVSKPHWPWPVWEPLDMEPQAECARQIAVAKGYEPTVLSTPAETDVDNVVAELQRVTQAVANGGDLFVSFAGHGTKKHPGVATLDPGGDDELWVLNNGSLCDNFLFNLWSTASADTRIVVLSDSCFGLGVAWQPFWAWFSEQKEFHHVLSDKPSPLAPVRLCPPLNNTSPSEIEGGFVLIAPGPNESTVTVEGMTCAVKAALDQNPRDFPDLLSKAQAILDQLPDGRIVKGLHFGKKGQEMWDNAPFS